MYNKINNGLIIQWGYKWTDNHKDDSLFELSGEIYMPISFLNYETYSIIATARHAGDIIQTNPATGSKFIYAIYDRVPDAVCYDRLNWIAMGY